MSMMKELYLARNLAELNKKAVLPDSVKKAKPRQVISGAEKLLNQAQREEDRDEELAYLSYMKFIDCIQLATSKGKNEDEAFLQKLIGLAKSGERALAKCEELSARLQQRYELGGMTTEANCANTSSSVERGIFTGPALIPGNRCVKLESEFQQSSQGMQSDEGAEDISVQDLKQLIELKSASLLIIDCRGRADFIAGHVDHPSCISIPEEILSPGISARKLTEILKNHHPDPDALNLWNTRADAEQVILCDWSSSFDNKSTALNALYDAMVKWDVGTRYKAKPYVLQGGIHSVHYSYPMLMNKPMHTKMPDSEPAKPVTKIPDINLVEYPSLENEESQQPKPAPAPVPNRDLNKLPAQIHGEVFPGSASKATFDRSKKPAVKQTNLASANWPICTKMLNTDLKTIATPSPGIKTVAYPDSPFLKHLLDGKKADVRIICNNGGYLAHSPILKSMSPVLSHMLESDLMEGISRQIVIDDVEGSTVEALLKFLYTGSLPSSRSETTLVELLYCAEKYDITELKDQISSLMLSAINAENTVEFTAAALRYQVDTTMRAKFIAKFHQNYSRCKKDDHFKTFMKEYVDILY